MEQLVSAAVPHPGRLHLALSGEAALALRRQPGLLESLRLGRPQEQALAHQQLPRAVVLSVALQRLQEEAPSDPVPLDKSQRPHLLEHLDRAPSVLNQHPLSVVPVVPPHSGHPRLARRPNQQEVHSVRHQRTLLQLLRLVLALSELSHPALLDNQQRRPLVNLLHQLHQHLDKQQHLLLHLHLVSQQLQPRRPLVRQPHQ